MFNSLLLPLLLFFYDLLLLVFYGALLLLYDDVLHLQQHVEVCLLLLSFGTQLLLLLFLQLLDYVVSDPHLQQPYVQLQQLLVHVVIYLHLLMLYGELLQKHAFFLFLHFYDDLLLPRKIGTMHFNSIFNNNFSKCKNAP